MEGRWRLYSSADQERSRTPRLFAMRFVVLLFFVVALALSAAEEDPKDAQELLRVGSLYNRSGQFDKAEPVLRRAVKLAPQSSAARIELALCLARLQRFKEASESIKGVAPPESAPQLLLYHRLKASIASGNGDDASAAAEMEKALQLAP